MSEKIFAEGYEEIKFEDKLIAIIIRKNFSSDKVVFFSPAEFSQQLGYLPYKKGHIINPHFHIKSDRNIQFTQEVLFIKKGKVHVKFYLENKQFLKSTVLNAGDILFLCSGGHGFEIIEDSEIFEVKQGPYSGRERDKETF